MFTDADFAGLFISEDREDPVSIKSRTCIILTFGEVLIFWSSKLQTEIALSPLEAEYISLSQGMRELVTSRGLLIDLTQHMDFKIANVSYVCNA